MIYNFFQENQEKEFVENELQLLKKEYFKQEMSMDQFNNLKQAMEDAKMTNQTTNKKKSFAKYVTVAAALAGTLILLPNTSSSVAHAMEQIPVIGQLVKVVTFRDYEYESEQLHADVEVPEIVVDETTTDTTTQDTLEKSVEQINEEIKRITDEVIADFKTKLEQEEGYQEVVVTSEVLTTTKEYFTLKLICYEAAASGYEWNHFYTINLSTGERLALKDFFIENADYITPISNNIKEQMQEQMAADENVQYWLHDEMEELNFKTITDETSFYVNENGNIVIAFNEGDVAPMYMGTVEFEIPSDILSEIRK